MENDLSNGEKKTVSVSDEFEENLVEKYKKNAHSSLVKEDLVSAKNYLQRKSQLVVQITKMKQVMFGLESRLIEIENANMNIGIINTSNVVNEAMKLSSISPKVAEKIIAESHKQTGDINDIIANMLMEQSDTSSEDVDEELRQLQISINIANVSQLPTIPEEAKEEDYSTHVRN
jgi:hypothetical protein